jgi:hypothetical protein
VRAVVFMFRLIYWKGYLECCRRFEGEFKNAGCYKGDDLPIRMKWIEETVCRVTDHALAETGRVIDAMPGPDSEETEP